MRIKTSDSSFSRGVVMKIKSNKGVPGLGTQIRVLRMQLGMTQQQLGMRAGFAQNVVAEIESGKRGDLCVSTLQRIARALECTPVVQILPQTGIAEILDRRSTEVAQKIVAVSSGSAAIEKQLPDAAVVADEVQAIKKELLKHKSSLWQEI
jgi:predicted DNA-binding mobile mystery protein A